MFVVHSALFVFVAHEASELPKVSGGGVTGFTTISGKGRAFITGLAMGLQAELGILGWMTGRANLDPYVFSTGFDQCIQAVWVMTGIVSTDHTGQH